MKREKEFRGEFLPIVKIVVFRSPTPVEIAVTVHGEEMICPNIQHAADQFFVSQSNR